MPDGPRNLQHFSSSKADDNSSNGCTDLCGWASGVPMSKVPHFGFFVYTYPGMVADHCSQCRPSYLNSADPKVQLDKVYGFFRMQIFSAQKSLPRFLCRKNLHAKITIHLPRGSMWNCTSGAHYCTIRSLGVGSKAALLPAS